MEYTPTARDAERLIDGCEKRICWLSFEFKNPRVIERRSNYGNSSWKCPSRAVGNYPVRAKINESVGSEHG